MADEKLKNAKVIFVLGKLAKFLIKFYNFVKFYDPYNTVYPLCSSYSYETVELKFFVHLKT